MSTSLTITLNARLRPLDRGEWFTDPLREVLQTQAPGSEITGAGTLLEADGEPKLSDIDLDLAGDPQAGLALVVAALEEMGAPRGSKASLAESDSVSFGQAEGVGLYLDGVNLADEVYASADINELIAQLLAGLGDHGTLMSYWEGPRETALYLYGPSASRIQELVADVVANHPLAQGCRVVRLN